MTVLLGKELAIALAAIAGSTNAPQGKVVVRPRPETSSATPSKVQPLLASIAPRHDFNPPGTLQEDSSALGKAGPQNPNSFNPQISLVSDFRALLVASDRKDDKKIDLHEVELGFAADVDPFLKAEAYISWSKEDGESKTEVEEAFGRYSNLGRGFSAKFGKIAAAIGRVQRNHADSLNFLDYPLVIQDLFGDEGLRAGGGSVSYLLPGDRFHEFTIEGLDPADAPLFGGTHSGVPVWVGHYRTFFDFNEDTSAQLGASYANGPAGAGAPGRSDLFGVDFVYKWTPGVKGKSLVFESEALWSKSGQAGTRRAFGAFGALTYQLKPNWFGYLKYDTSEAPITRERRNAWAVGLTLRPTEFHHWRVEFQQIRSTLAPTKHVLNVQFQLAIGAHPAHKY